MGTLSIQVDSVKESPRRFHLVSDRDWWEEERVRLSEGEAELRSPFALELTGYRIGARLLFRGELVGAIELPCASCAETYTHEFREAMELLLEPANESDKVPRGSVVLDPEQDGLGRYAGDEIGFEDVLHDALAVSWPMQPRCSESCRGLCPLCGANRNLEPCRCDSSAASRPFAALAGLMKPSRSERR